MKSIDLELYGYRTGTTQRWGRSDIVTFFPHEKKIVLATGREFSDPSETWWYPAGANCEQLRHPWLVAAWGEFIRKVCGHSPLERYYRYARLTGETPHEWIFRQSIWGYDSDGEIGIVVKKDDWSFAVKTITERSNITI